MSWGDISYILYYIGIIIRSVLTTASFVFKTHVQNQNITHEQK